MQIYLPIAGMPVDIFLILSLGGITGVLSGMFGVGGGFLMTPLLIFIGIPPAIAVSSSANQIIAASFSGFIAHWRRQNVDFTMGTLLLVGGMVGSSLGVWLFARLQELGQVDLVISLSYVLFLGSIGILMAIESIKVIFYKRNNIPAPKKELLPFLDGISLPFKMHFPRSKLHVSVILPITIGFLVGILVSLMGVGGGFLIVPAMIYLLRMPTSVVIGTSLFQIVFITANVTFLQAIQTHTVDIVLALLMLTGSVVGAQFGTRIGMKLPAEQLRAMMAILVLLVVLKLGYRLFVQPANLFEVIPLGML